MGAVWMLLMKLVIRSLGLISTAILARLLDPADFGIIAITMALFAFIALFAEFGFDTQLIQKQGASSAHYDTAWSLNLCFSLVASVVLLLAAPLMAASYDDPRLLDLLRCAAVLFLFSGLQNIGVANFRKELQFQREFRFLVLPRIAGFLVTIPSAFLLGSYWALLAGIAALKFSSMVLSYAMNSYRPRLCFDHVAELFQFSKWLIANNVLTFLGARAPNLILGKVLSPEAAGYYSVGRDLPEYIVSDVVGTMNRATFPGYARIADDVAALRTVYLKVVGSLALYVLPASIGICCVADPLVRTLLGDKWLSVIDIIQVLAFGNLFAALSTNSSYVYLSLGLPRVLPLLSALRIVIMLPALVVLSASHGLVGAAYAVVAASMLTSSTSALVLRRKLGLTTHNLVAVFARPVLGTTAMVAALLALDHFVPLLYELPALVELLARTGTGAVVYIGVVGGMWLLAGRPDGLEALIIQLTLNRLSRAKRALVRMHTRG